MKTFKDAEGRNIPVYTLNEPSASLGEGRRRMAEAEAILNDPLSDLNLRLLAAQVSALQSLDPSNRALQLRIYRDEEARRSGPKIWRAIFPND